METHSASCILLPTTTGPEPAYLSEDDSIMELPMSHTSIFALKSVALDPLPRTVRAKPPGHFARRNSPPWVRKRDAPMHSHHFETELEAAGARRPCLPKEESACEDETTLTPSQFGDGYDSNAKGGRREPRQLRVKRSAVRRSSAAAGLVAVFAASIAPGVCGFANLSPSTPFHLQNFLGNAVTRLGGVGYPRSNVASSIQMASPRPIRDGADKQVRGRGMKRGRGLSNSETPAAIVRDVSLDSEEDEEEYVGSWGGVGTNSKRFVADDDWAMWLNHGFPDMLKTISALSDERASARKAAVGALLKCAAEHPAGPTAPWAVASLLGRMEDDSACVREAAVRGLVKVSERGNEAVVMAMASLIEEETAVTVKKAALQALPRVANRGDEKALAPVMKLLEAVQGHERGDIFYPHLSHKLSKHAVRALGTLAGRGNEVVLKALHVRILDDPEPSVREAAARSIGNLADADDARSVAALYLCMEDEDEQVRRAAAKSTRTMMKRMREVNVQTEEDEDQDEVEGECGASRLWLLPGMWGG